ncbi:NADH dehydrogenase [Dyella nitratireducens]|uniref:NADH:ubiquinone reductase (non-electrogenic) n=1 Tax=Dyella nitratireducens TaxID=1849580 RepID=A0ABQ1FLH6_9GAMM|nr:NAD(P)/FAD-dependent oxidoreductase [Dyella nitratireducens]GGA20271.1 NADH dehydrogenase [Dyella nitratireducens]GLQ44401.1 NADH dehydrogenase [Dyella nitratireducens]
MKATSPLHRVVIIGAGFGGLEAARHLGHQPVDVTVIDRSNHHVFQPLLYQVAGAALDISQIAWPIRHVLRRFKNVTTLMAEVDGVDTTAKTVRLTDGKRIPYDTLVIATGATHAYFGHDEWAQFAPGLKTLGDALSIRQHLLTVFEQAEREPDPDKRQKLQTFVVIGAGATGVELACTIAELALEEMPGDFRHADTRTARVIVVEAASRVLSSFPEPLSDYVLKTMEHIGVTVMLNCPVTECHADGVVCNDKRIDAGAVFWAAGVRASPAAQWLNVPADRAGRVKVEGDLHVAAHPDIFVIGDTALVEQENGKPVPGLAPAAKQQGQYVAELIKARLHNRPAPRPFRYRNYGNLSTIGKHTAVVDFGKVKLRGRVAWAMWALAHIYFLIGVRNRLMVALNWLWLYIKGDRGARIILSRKS